MEVIRRSDLEGALSQEYRQYLTGRLERPQPLLKHIDDDIEIGMSYYQTFTPDVPHMHPVATEHTLVLRGCVRIRLLDGSRTEDELHEGDFFVIRPGIPYATKNMAGTQVLFIKSPGLNDKTLIEVDEATKEWLGSWE